MSKAQTMGLTSPVQERVITLFLLDLILDLLDTKNSWFTTEEIAARVKSSESETTTLLEFLAEYGLVILDTKNRRAKINQKMHNFLEETRRAQAEESTSVCKSEEIALSNCRKP